MIDQYGLIVQQDGDGGDCPARCGVAIGVRWMWGDKFDATELLDTTQKYLRNPIGYYFRHPIRWNDTWDFSRDQASRLMLGYMIARRRDLAVDYYERVLHNNVEHPNGDMVGFGEVVNYWRSARLAWLTWPLLVLFDCKYFIDIISYKWQPWDIDNLFIMDLYYAQKKCWTPTAWLAAKLYDKNAAKARVINNLLNAATNGCREAGEANIWFLDNL